MKTRIFNLIILDESGSMCSIERQAVSGVNETIQTIKQAQKKHEDQEHFISLITFNAEGRKTLYDKVEALHVENFSGKQYHPDSCTPLYDAMGFSLNKLRKRVAEEDRVLVTVITDGYENASREYSGASIKNLVDELQSEGWVFTYIGANQDAEEVAHSLYIPNALNFKGTKEDTIKMFKKENRSRMRFFDRMAEGLSLRELQHEYFEEEKPNKKK
jgi:Mg-chelatase subunit ChlD